MSKKSCSILYSRFLNGNEQYLLDTQDLPCGFFLFLTSFYFYEFALSVSWVVGFFQTRNLFKAHTSQYIIYIQNQFLYLETFFAYFDVCIFLKQNIKCYCPNKIYKSLVSNYKQSCVNYNGNNVNYFYSSWGLGFKIIFLVLWFSLITILFL